MLIFTPIHNTQLQTVAEKVRKEEDFFLTVSNSDNGEAGTRTRSVGSRPVVATTEPDGSSARCSGGRWQFELPPARRAITNVDTNKIGEAQA